MPSPASNRPIDGSNDSAGSAPAARAAAEIIAIATRDDFLLEIGEALSGQTSVRPVDSVETALDQLGGNRKVTQLLAIDARDVEDLRGSVDFINSQAPHMVVLVFADAEAERQTAAALKGSNVFAVLTLPIDKRKTAAVLDGAIADAVNRRPAHTPRQSGNDMRLDRGSSITVETAPADSANFTDLGESGSGGNKSMIMIGGGVAAVVIAALAAWYFMSGPSAPAPAQTQKASVSVTADAENLPSDEDVVAEAAPVVDLKLVNGTADELLEKARLAMRERRYTEPNGDNALLYYRSAVAVDAQSGEAKDGLRRVAAVLSARFDEAFADAKYEEAALALANLKVATPEDERVPALEAKLATTQINKMLAEGNIDRAASLVKGAQQSGSVPDQQIARWKGEIARRQDESKQKRLLDLARDAIRDGRLSDGNDSAKAYADQLNDMGPGASGTYQRVMRELGSAYMKKAREAAAAGRSPDVDRWLAEARSAGVSSSDVNSFQRDLAAARQKAESAEINRLAGLARDRLKEGKLVEPANDSAAYYLTALQAADDKNALISSGSRELATKLLDRASTAAREGRTQQSEADLTQARRWGADPKDIQAIQQASAARRAPAPRPAASNGSSSASNSSSGSAAPAAPTPPEDLQSKLKRVRYVPPEYPERALSQRISGEVTLEFRVNLKGDTQDVRVVAAEPAGTFDRAAVTAVKRWRYEPLIVDGQAQEVEARAVIRFALPDQ